MNSTSNAIAVHVPRITQRRATLNGEGTMIREELTRLFTHEERHRRLFARLLLAAGLSAVVFVIGRS
jgi:hypothetical protein